LDHPTIRRAEENQLLFRGKTRTPHGKEITIRGGGTIDASVGDRAGGKQYGVFFFFLTPLLLSSRRREARRQTRKESQATRTEQGGETKWCRRRETKQEPTQCEQAETNTHPTRRRHARKKAQATWQEPAMHDRQSPE